MPDPYTSFAGIGTGAPIPTPLWGCRDGLQFLFEGQKFVAVLGGGDEIEVFGSLFHFGFGFVNEFLDLVFVHVLQDRICCEGLDFGFDVGFGFGTADIEDGFLGEDFFA